MKALATFILFLTVFLVFGTVLRDDFAPGMPDEGLILISGLAAAALVWIWLRITNPPAPPAVPPTLEDLERALAATPALVWEAAPAATQAKPRSSAERAAPSSAKT